LSKHNCRREHSRATKPESGAPRSAGPAPYSAPGILICSSAVAARERPYGGTEYERGERRIAAAAAARGSVGLRSSKQRGPRVATRRDDPWGIVGVLIFGSLRESVAAGSRCHLPEP